MKKIALCLALVGALAALAETSVSSASLKAIFADGWKKGSVVSFVSSGGREYAAAKATPLFEIETRDVQDPAQVSVQSAWLAQRCVFEPVPDGVRIVYDGFTGGVARVVCTVTGRAGDASLRWRLAATPAKGRAVTYVDYPKICLACPLGASGADDFVVAGAKPWGLVRNPAATLDPSKWQSVGGRQPGALFAAFGGYYDDQGGIYSAAEDEVCHAKAMWLRRTSSGLELVWRRQGWAESADEQTYDVVTRSFAGSAGEPADWYDAADLYRAWARARPWCRQTIAEKAFLPDWMRDAPAMVRFPRSWMEHPALVSAWLDGYWAKFFPKAPLLAAVWGWEKVDTWITPDYFPVFPDDATFRKILAAFRAHDAKFFPWPSGYNFTITYRPDGKGAFEYDNRAAFEAMRHLAIARPDGAPNTRSPDWYFGGEMGVVCPGDARTRAWWTAQVAGGLLDRGAEAIQFDQVNGGSVPGCWSRGHGHPPGWGTWCAEAFRAQFASVRAAAETRGVKAVLGVEDPNEFYLDLAGVQDYRDCELDGTNRVEASVWNYLYHEFAPTFQSNPRRGNRWMQAHCLVDGQIPFLMPEFGDCGAGDGGVPNGDFELLGGKKRQPAVWRFGRNPTDAGTMSVETVDVRSGRSAVRIVGGETARASLWQDRGSADDGLLLPGGRYRYCFWAKTVRGKTAACGNCLAFTRDWKKLTSTAASFPAADAGWTRVAAEFTMPETCAIFHLIFTVPPGTEVLVDDVRFEGVGANGQAVALPPRGESAYTRFMSRWVALYHGEGRDFLAHGRRIRPPRVACAEMPVAFSRGKVNFQMPMPAVCSAAYESLDGTRRVLALANATARRQKVAWTWKGRRHEKTLPPDGPELVPLD